MLGNARTADTPLPVLAPGLGKTKTARLWTYVRDGRPRAHPGTRRRCGLPTPWTARARTRTTAAIQYGLNRWQALTRYCMDGVIEIDNSAAQRALREVARGRKNFLLAGADSGGEGAPTTYALLGTAKLNGMDPEVCLRHVLGHSAEHPITRIDDLLLWHIAGELPSFIANA